jgi:hypothetical protein
MSVETGGGPSLVDGKKNSRDPSPPENRQSHLSEHEDSRYDCRNVYSNFFLEADDGEEAEYRCDSWDCYCCGHRMQMNIAEELDRLVQERPELRRLLTLTLDPATAPRDQGEQHRYLTERFNALRTEIKDRYPDLSYVWIREEGESDNPHLHLLVDRYMPQAELSKLSARVGLGHVVDIRRVNARNAAKYVTKYLTKGAMSELPKGSNRYGSSADIDLAVRGPSDDDRDDDDREWRLLMRDHEITPETDADGPLRRGVTNTDFWLQQEHGGPLGRPPPRDGRPPT